MNIYEYPISITMNLAEFWTHHRDQPGPARVLCLWQVPHIQITLLALDPAHPARAWCILDPGMLDILWGYYSCKNTLRCSKGRLRLHLIKRLCCISVWNTAFVWQVWVCCWRHLAYSAETGFCWRDTVALILYSLYKVEWAPGHFFKQYILFSGHEHIWICSLSSNTWLEFWRNNEKNALSHHPAL